MSKRTVIRILLISLFVLALGYAVNWWLAFGIGVGILLCIWIYEYRYSIVDEVDTEIFWQRKNPWKNSEEPEYFEEVNLWWRGNAFTALVVVVIVAALIVVGLLGVFG